MPFEDSHQAPRREIELEQARRHLREAVARLARQRKIVSEMDAYSSARAAELGRELLELMEVIVAEAQRHVRRLEGDGGE